MGRVLISPLGAGFLHDLKRGTAGRYRTALYDFRGLKKESPFIAAVLVEFLEIEELILFGTVKSMWDEVYRYFTPKEDFNEEYYQTLFEKIESSSYGNKVLKEEDLLPLEEALRKRLGGKRSKCFIIEYGVSEAELWKNMESFLKLKHIIEDGDEIFFDITHSFRSLSLFLFLSLEFLMELTEKKVEIKGVYYGMLDVIKDLGYAPIVDLKALYDLNIWIKAMYNFKNYGNAFLLSELFRAREKFLSDQLWRISQAINFNDIYALQDSVRKIKRGLIKKLDVPEKFIKGELEKFLGRFSFRESEPHLLQLELAKWYYEKKRFASSVLVLREAVITYVCEKIGWDWRQKVKREECSLNIPGGELKYIWSELREIRNLVAHPYGREKDVEENIKKILELLKKTEKIFHGGGNV